MSSMEAPDRPGGSAAPYGGQVSDVVPGRTKRWARWLGIAAICVLLLAVLGYAETHWLHELPQDRVSRVALVAYPSGSAPVVNSWSTQLTGAAKDPGLVQDVVTKLDLRESSTGKPMSPRAVADRLSVESQCVEVTTETGRSVRGLLLIAVVRGPSEEVTDRLSDEWTHEFVARSARTYPGLTVEPVESLRGTYEICT